MADLRAVFDANDQTSPLSIPASQTALLLLDFHSFLISSMPPEAQTAVATASSIREWARSQDIKVVHCLIDFAGKTPPQLKIAARATQLRNTIRNNGPDAPREITELTPLADEYVFWRPLGSISALSSYGLTAFLEHHGIKSVVLAGVATSGCVLDTAKAASESGLVVSVVEDACADRTVEKHRFIMQNLLGTQCHVATRDAFVAAGK